MADEFKGIGNESLRNVESIKSSMEDIAKATSRTNTLLGQTDQLLSSYRAQFNSINSSANKFAQLQDEAQRSAKATSKAFAEQQKQLSVVRSLNAQIDNLYDQMLEVSEDQAKVLLKQVENLSAARDNAKGLANEFGSLAEDSAKLDKSTMWFSALSKVAGDIPGLRKLAGPFEAAAKASRETVLNNAKNNTNQSAGIAGLQAGFKALGPIISSALGPLAIITTIISAFKALIDMMFEADKQVTEIAKSLNVSKEAARDVRQRFFEISDTASSLGKIQEGNLILQKDLVETQLQLNQLLGISVDLSQEQNAEFAVQLTNARKFLKLSEDEQKGLVSLYSTTGKSIDEVKTSILGTTRLRKIESGVLLDERKILKDVLTASNAIKLSVKGGAEGLTKAAMAAAELGSDLKSVENISKGLLNFEESISSELEAELLLGKDLNLETARRAALNGDLETVAKEINNQVGSAADFTRMNVIQQEALAKAMGTSRDELADMLVQQESLNKLKGSFNALSKETLATLKTSGKIDEATYKNLVSGKAASTDYYDALKQAGMAQKEIIELLGDEAAISLESQSAQEKFNDAMDKAKEVFSSFVDGGYLDSLADTLVEVIKFLQGYTEGEEKAVTTARELKQQGNLSEEEQKKVDTLKKAATDEKGFFGTYFTYLTEGVAGAAIQMYKNMAAEEAQTQLETIKSEKIQIPAKDFVIKTLEEDTVVAAGGTNLGRTDEMVALLKELTMVMKQGGNVYLDLQKVGTTTDQSTYKLNS